MFGFTGRPTPGEERIIAASAVAVSHTGNLAETTLATVNIPAGLIGPNGQVEIEALFSMTNNANNKTPTVKFGGNAVVGGFAVASFAAFQGRVRLANRNNQASQVHMHHGFYGNFGTTTAAPPVLAVNTALVVPILFTGLLAVATDTITLESYIVRVTPRS